MWPLMWSVTVQKTLFFISAALFVFLSSSWSSARHLVSFILMLSRLSADNWSFYKNPHLHLHTNRITMSTISILISWFELNLCVFTYSWLQSGINECFFCVFLLKYFFRFLQTDEIMWCFSTERLLWSHSRPIRALSASDCHSFQVPLCARCSHVDHMRRSDDRLSISWFQSCFLN